MAKVSTIRDLLLKYEIGEVLGMGGFGIVKRGRHRQTGEAVAIKVVDRHLFTARNIAHESGILARVDHPNCIRLLEAIATPKRVYLVTDYVSGGELLSRLQERGSLTESAAAFLMAQVLKGVAYLHSSGIVHRDLKLENLLLSDSSARPTVKIADFGLSKVFTAEVCATICGSTPYMAPELLRLGPDAERYSHLVDVWSAGVILYILLAGFCPFDAESDEAMKERIRNGAVDFSDPAWQTISPDAKSLLGHMLAVDSDARWSAEACSRHPWLVREAEWFATLSEAEAWDSMFSGRSPRVDSLSALQSRSTPAKSGREGRIVGAPAGKVPADLADYL